MKTVGKWVSEIIERFKLWCYCIALVLYVKLPKEETE